MYIENITSIHLTKKEKDEFDKILNYFESVRNQIYTIECKTAIEEAIHAMRCVQYFITVDKEK